MPSLFVSMRPTKGLKLVGILAALSLAAVYSAGVRLEARDSFCASCHVEPEGRYYRQSRSPGEMVTLAASHARERTRCIDCHSRNWIPGRLWSQWGGLQNLAAYLSGDFRNPSETTRPVGEGGCTKCHLEGNWVTQRPGHYHSPILRGNWKAAGGPPDTCGACHPSHREFLTGTQQTDPAEVESQCEDCHKATGS